jgi:hypothetical protein
MIVVDAEARTVISLYSDCTRLIYPEHCSDIAEGDRDSHDTIDISRNLLVLWSFVQQERHDASPAHV